MKNIRSFEKYLRDKGYSSATISAYCNSVRLYLSSGYKIAVDDLCRWKEEEIRRVKVGTVTLRIHAINKYMEFRGQAFRLKPLKIDVPDYVEDELTAGLYAKLISSLEKDGNWEWYAVIKLLACTGMRISEAMQVEAWHIQKDGYIDIIGKGSKVRRVWFSSSLRKELEGKLEEGRIIRHDQRYIRMALHRLAEKYHLPKRPMHPHAFRAFFARQVYARTKDLQFVQNLLGHASIKTTMRYLRKSSKGMRRRISQIVTW